LNPKLLTATRPTRATRDSSAIGLPKGSLGWKEMGQGYVTVCVFNQFDLKTLFQRRQKVQN
jgi:hypothetical protein